MKTSAVLFALVLGAAASGCSTHQEGSFSCSGGPPIGSSLDYEWCTEWDWTIVLQYSMAGQTLTPKGAGVGDGCPTGKSPFSCNLNLALGHCETVTITSDATTTKREYIYKSDQVDSAKMACKGTWVTK